MALILGSILVTVACGGAEPAKEPPTTSSTTATPTPVTTTPPADTTPAPAASTPAPEAKPAVEEPPALVFEGLKVAPAKGAKVKSVELKADGTVVVDGKTVATFSKNELHDETGAVAFAVKKDGSIEGGKVSKPVSFNDKDELQTDGKKSLSVGDDGAAKVEKDGGKSDAGPVKFDGVTSKNKRAAVLLVALLTAPKDAAKKADTTATTAKPGDAKPAAKTDAAKPAAPKK
jgi:hypothetical protein